MRCTLFFWLQENLAGHAFVDVACYTMEQFLFRFASKLAVQQAQRLSTTSALSKLRNIFSFFPTTDKLRNDAGMKLPILSAGVLLHRAMKRTMFFLVLYQLCYYEHTLLFNGYLFAVGRIENSSRSICSRLTRDTFHLILSCSDSDFLCRIFVCNFVCLYDLWSGCWELGT